MNLNSDEVLQVKMNERVVELKEKSNMSISAPCDGSLLRRLKRS
jgi:hypothetical protein